MGLSVSARGPLFLLTSFTAGQTLGGPARLRGVGLVFAVTHGAPPRASAVVMPVCEEYAISLFSRFHVVRKGSVFY